MHDICPDSFDLPNQLNQSTSYQLIINKNVISPQSFLYITHREISADMGILSDTFQCLPL